MLIDICHNLRKQVRKQRLVTHFDKKFVHYEAPKCFWSRLISVAKSVVQDIRIFNVDETDTITLQGAHN